jgi:hypothetical protein
MPSYQWNSVCDSARPKEGEVVNVIARCVWDSKEKQFLAIYTSYWAQGETKSVWSPLGSNPLSFESKTVTHWTQRLDPPGVGGWRYNGMGD